MKIVSISARDGIDISPTLLRREALKFADAARNVPQTRRVKHYGLPDEEISVEINARSLSALGLSIGDIARTLSLADVKTPAGKLLAPENALTLEVSGDFVDVQSVRDTFIKGKDNRSSAIRISDIATVTKAETDPPRRLALSNGRRAVFLAIEMKEGFQVDKYSDTFDQFLTDYRSTAAEGLIIETTYDQSGYTEARLTGVAKNIVAGISIVVAVLFVTLGWRAAAIVALSLPLCTLVSMVVLDYLSVPIHQLSMTGLVVALGLLVDGSIVVTDEIRKRLLAG